jgi:hypothetical protein
VTVDLEALGLIPVPKAGDGATNGRLRNGRLQAASPEDQREFERLMGLAGVQPRRGGEELARCPSPDHEDRHPSCAVNWQAAVFHCHSCSARGGIGALRRLLGEETPVRGDGVPLNCDSRMSDVEHERSRLVHAMKGARLTRFNRKTSRALFEEVIECHRGYRKYECDKGHREVVTFSCGFPLCPICVPSRLRADFERHADKLPDRFALFVVRPAATVADDAVRARRELQRWVKRWRKEMGLEAGFYGVRLTVGRPDVLLVLPADSVPVTLLTDAHVTFAAADVDLNGAVSWYQRMFLEEVTSWRTTAEMLDLLGAVKGRRRFQGFGRYYRREESADDGGEHLLTGEQKDVFRASGGAATGGSKAVICSECGGRMRFMGIAASAEESEAWVRGPPVRAGQRG